MALLTPMLLTMVVFHFSVFVAASAVFSTKVDEVSDPSIKCGQCSCADPCSHVPPAHPPPPPPPRSCRPPPPPRFVYVTGPPGNLYPNEPFSPLVNGVHDSLPSLGAFLLVGCSALQLLAFC